MNQIIENITEIDIPFFFDLIYQIIESFSSEQDLDVIKICEKCRQRILNEIKKPSKLASDGETNTFISKCFNIIKLLTEKDKNILNHIPQIEQILEPIFEYMKNPVKIDFEEEIIYIISCFIKITKTIVPSAQKLFLNLDKYFNQNNTITEELYELLSYFILYGTDFLRNDPNFLNFVFKKLI